MGSTLLLEILQEQLDEAQAQDNYTPSPGLKKLVSVSTIQPKVVRKKSAKRIKKLSKIKKSTKKWKRKSVR